MQKPLRVAFRGEEGVDAGGVTREFFQLLVMNLFDPQFAMFQAVPSGALWFADQTLESERALHMDSFHCVLAHESLGLAGSYQLAGLLCGLGIYNRVVLDLQLPTAVYKKLLGHPVDLFDLVEIKPELARGLQHLLAYEDEEAIEDIFALDFTVVRVRDLAEPSGALASIT